MAAKTLDSRVLNYTEAMKYFINEGECFIRVSKHKKSVESTRPMAELLLLFPSAWKPWLNTKPEFMKWLLKRTLFNSN